MGNATIVSRVALVRTDERARGVGRAIDLLGGIESVVSGHDVLVKPNFNTADPYPGSTHNDTLEALIVKLGEMGAGLVTVGDRSGPTSTAGTLEKKGIAALCERLGAGLLNFEDMPDERWEHIVAEGSHWRKGFYFARPVLESGCVVSTCCLKTHGYGGVFTISLKNTIGMLHQRNMTELHTSFLSMRKMIAEANAAYSPALVVVDAMDAMVDKGPMKGPTQHAGLIFAGTDRVAVDAVGLAVLKMLGSNSKIMDTPIFAQEQIARAVELGLGAEGPEVIEIVSAEDATSREAASAVRAELDKG